VLRHLVQTLRSDLNLLSSETRKKYPAVREVSDARLAVLVREGLEAIGLDNRSDCEKLRTNVELLTNFRLIGAAMNQI